MQNKMKFLTKILIPSLLATSVSAHAITIAIPLASSSPLTISSSVTPLDNNLWQYSYTITNTSLFDNHGRDFTGLPLMSFSVPYFPDGNVSAITAPSNWTATVFDPNALDPLTQQPIGQESFFGPALVPGSQTLIWSASVDNYCFWSGGSGCIYSALLPGASLSGFSYVGGYGPAKAPYEATFDPLISGASPYEKGDPPIPASPLALAAGLPMVTDVPEPATTALLGLGMLGFAASRRKSAKSKNA